MMQTCASADGCMDAGTEHDVPASVGGPLVEARAAVIVAITEAEAPATETATIEPPENATLPAPKSKGRR